MVCTVQYQPNSVLFSRILATIHVLLLYYRVSVASSPHTYFTSRCISCVIVLSLPFQLLTRRPSGDGALAGSSPNTRSWYAQGALARRHWYRYMHKIVLKADVSDSREN